MIYVALLGLLPAALFPEDVAALRGSLRQKIIGSRRLWRPAPARMEV
jgi:hypothetical protein